MGFINNIKLKNKLFLMLLVPIVGMVVFSTLLFRTASSETENAEKMSLLTDVAIEVNRSIGSIQSELEITSKFIKAYGKKFTQELENSQLETDNKLLSLNKSIEALSSVTFNQTFDSRLADVKANIAALTEKRSAIKNKKLNRNKTQDYFHKLVEDMLYLIELMPRLTTDKELANITSAFVNFMRLKNLAGLEREILYNVFKRDQFIGKEFKEFNKSVNYQSVYESSFLSLANDSEKEFFKNILSDGSVLQAEEMRKKAFLSADYGAFNIEPDKWLDIQTTKLQLLNKVAEKLTQDVKLRSELTQTSSSNLKLMISLAAIFTLEIISRA